eukprot:TRINITY_DN38068_c0_g1_i1.p1 TRINITY_DN38068_c0_g1~~TRINITY_DN38068_c0_g1_i1.p1  ORF type:complete len:332 (-),score=40.28 TRINITY_DN38068_c0_g1_i1:149-1108(-)
MQRDRALSWHSETITSKESREHTASVSRDVTFAAAAAASKAWGILPTWKGAPSQEGSHLDGHCQSRAQHRQLVEDRLSVQSRLLEEERRRIEADRIQLAKERQRLEEERRRLEQNRVVSLGSSRSSRSQEPHCESRAGKRPEAEREEKEQELKLEMHQLRGWYQHPYALRAPHHAAPPPKTQRAKGGYSPDPKQVYVAGCRQGTFFAGKPSSRHPTPRSRSPSIERLHRGEPTGGSRCSSPGHAGSSAKSSRSTSRNLSRSSSHRANSFDQASPRSLSAATIGVSAFDRSLAASLHRVAPQAMKRLGSKKSLTEISRKD